MRFFCIIVLVSCWLSSVCAHAGVIRQGVRHLSKSGSTGLIGDVTLSAGSNIILTQIGQNITITASSSGGGGTDFPYTSYTSDATITNAEYDIRLDPAAGTGTINITLFPATGNNGHHLNFDQVSDGVVKIFTVGGETIGYGSDTDAQTNLKGNLTIGAFGGNWNAL
jgi:hypothetical protein